MTTLGDDTVELFEDLFEVSGVALSVTRGAGPAVVVDAIIGRTRTERLGDENIYGSSQPWDFIVKQADWVSKVGGEPQTNDYLAWTDDGSNERTAQVSVDDRERHFDPVGQFGLLWRVHSTEI